MKQKFMKDAIYMVSCIEETHPIFVTDGQLPNDYNTKRKEFLEYTKGDITEKEFIFAAQKFICALKDGHMKSLFSKVIDGKPQPVVFGGFIEVAWASENERLFLTNEYGESSEEIIKIGGAPVEKIFMLIDTYFYSENEADRDFNYSVYSRYGALLEMAGADTLNNTTTLTISRGGVQTDIDMEMRDVNALTSLTGYKTYDYVIKNEMMGDIFYIDLRLCTPGKDISLAASEIKKAVALGTKKFIIDLRGHGGGDSAVGETLLKAMGIRKIPAHGTIVRISPLSAKQTYGLFHGICGPILKRVFPKGVRYERSVTTVNPNNVFISVLTDSLTYSAGTMLAVWVQDGKLGNVIGTPSRNSPTYFANMLQAVMPDSKIYFRISCKQFLRPNESANQDTLTPDITINPNDALKAALVHLCRV